MSRSAHIQLRHRQLILYMESGEEEKLSSIYVLRRNIHEAVSAAIKKSTVARVLVARCSNAVGGITQYRLETRSY